MANEQQIMNPVAAMQLAVEEARRGAGHVAPNPLVGCTVLDAQMRFLSRGYHHAIGQAHAEVEALRGVDREALRGAHLFVTLEPCAHQGRTPSCARMLAELPIASVSFGLEDPNPLVAGQGAAILREAGIQTFNIQQVPLSEWLSFFAAEASAEEFEDLRWQVEEVAEIFLHNMRRQEPFVALKIASTLDGKIALPHGESQWITSEASRLEVHRLRAHYDAVVVGRGTFMQDNPSLNVRHPDWVDHLNRVVLMDPQARSLERLATSNLCKVRPLSQITLICEVGAAQHRVPGLEELHRVEVERLENGRLNLRQALRLLFEQRVTSLFVEGGALTYSAFLAQKCAHRLYLFQAPKIFGQGLGWADGLQTSAVSEAMRLEHGRWAQFGADMLLTGRLS